MEVVTAIETIYKIGKTIYEHVQKAKANKHQCQELAQHLQIVIGHLERLGDKKRSDAPAFAQAVYKLEKCAKKCEALILKFSDDSSWYTPILNVCDSYGIAASFEECHQQLFQHLQQMCLAVDIELLDNHKTSTDTILKDLADLQKQAKSIARRQVSANKSLSRLEQGQAQVTTILEQNLESKLIEIVEGQKNLAQAIAAHNPASSLAYKMDLHEVIFDEQNPSEIVQRQAAYTLYKAKWHGQAVIVKLLYGSLQGDKKLIREAEILSNLHCDNIVHLLGACFEKEGSLIVMEATENGSLEDVIKNKRSLSPALKKRITHEIVLGLYYLHTKEVYYKEFNAASILFNADWHAKLANFGSSSSAGLSSVSFSESDSEWRAPEILKGKKRYEKRAADIYSLGLILWSLWSNKLPFQEVAKDNTSLKEYILSGKREPISADIPEVFQTIIQRCWADNPDERISLEEIVKLIKLDALDTLMAGEGALEANFERELYHFTEQASRLSLMDAYQKRGGKIAIGKEREVPLTPAEESKAEAFSLEF